MPLILQTSKRPTEVLLALNRIATEDVTRVRAAVAYVTRDGAETLYRELDARITNWKTIPKVLVTSFDFGLTDPDALARTIAIPNFEVFVANLVPAADGGFAPSGRSNFHPKMYVFDRGGRRDLLVGSANLSGRALDVNTEACYLENDAPALDVERLWTALIADAVPLTTELLQRYRDVRRRPVFDPSPPLIAAPMPTPRGAPAFPDALATRGIDPVHYEHFWVEAGSMTSGGSRNQLELPRGGNRFFGFTFTRYGRSTKATPVGQIDLSARGVSFPGRPLTWHGHNRMERLNLPTRAKGGFTYEQTAVLFTRRGTHFDLEAAPWNSAQATAWRNASAIAGLIFKLGGAASTRFCGLF